jgi:hypothetical protein
MAFPTTPILDNFTRADENPIKQCFAPNPIWSGDGLCKIVSNQLAPVAASPTNNDAFCSVGFQSSQEIYITVDNVSGLTTIGLYCRINQANTAGFINTDYHIDFLPGTSELKFWRDSISPASAQLGATVSGVSLANGDSIGLSCIGSTIEAWKKPSGGSWASLGNRTDSNLTGGGQIGVNINVTTTAPRFSNFGGGKVPDAAGTPTDITGKARAPFRSAWSYLQHNTGAKTGGSFFAKTIMFDDIDTADRDSLIHFWLSAPSAAFLKTDKMFFGAM